VTINCLRTIAASSVLATVLVASTLAQTEKAKLLPTDGAYYDWFGIAVAIDGTTAIVGANQDDDKGTNSGSAYLFDTNTGAQIVKLVPSDGAAGDGFGISMAIDGTTAIVGALLDDYNGTDSGSAYLFDTNTGAPIAKLGPSDGASGDLFGVSVAIDGTTAIVGAYQDDDNGSYSGSAYLFDTNTGAQIAKLVPSDGASGDLFGVSVAIDGTTAIVGAYQDDDNGNQSGSAYLFDTNTGAQIVKLVPSDGASGEFFGLSVAIDGTTAIVGAGRDDDNGFDSGSAYLFDTNTGAQIAKLLPNDGAANDWFGRRVAIDGTTAIVGAYQDDDNGNQSGSAYLFDTNTGAQVAKLVPSDGAGYDSFGVSVAIDGTNAIIGAMWDNDNGTDSGSAYLFEYDCNGNGIPDNQDIADGTSADCNANGRPDECEIADDLAKDWNGDGVLDVCTPPNYCTANPNSTGLPAVMSVSGSPLISDNNFTLTASQMPAFEFGYFLMASSQGFIPNVGGSAGNLCLGSPFYRFNKPPKGTILSSGSSGTFSFTPNLLNLPQGVVFQVGETWNFQAWFRDGAGNTSNFTDGIAVMFR